ncbi:MAG: HD-GYP domain-containing protein [bacterium]
MIDYTLYTNSMENPLKLKSLEKLFNLLMSLRSPVRYSHCIRVSKYSEIIASALGMSKKQIKYLRIAGMLHDIGFSAMNDRILDKNTSLTSDEYEYIKLHPAIGTKILNCYNFPDDIAKGVMQHHEAFDGSGYPLGLKAKQISIYGRILFLSESFDTMTNSMPYKPAYSIDVAIKVIKQLSNKYFDPELVDIVLNSEEISSFYKQKDRITDNVCKDIDLDNINRLF